MSPDVFQEKRRAQEDFEKNKEERLRLHEEWLTQTMAEADGAEGSANDQTPTGEEPLAIEQINTASNATMQPLSPVFDFGLDDFVLDICDPFATFDYGFGNTAAGNYNENHQDFDYSDDLIYPSYVVPTVCAPLIQLTATAFPDFFEDVQPQ